MKKPKEAQTVPTPFDASKWMVVILAVYALLAMAYISVTPYRTAGRLLSRMTDVVQPDIGAPDERQHTNYVRHIVREKSFPVFDPKSPDLYETYQSHQPPLYYLIAAPFSALAGENDDVEKWALRFVNVMLGGLVIWGIFVGIRRLTGHEITGLVAAAITAFLPMFLALAGAVSNDMALFLVGVWLMNIISLGWEKSWTLKRCLLLGAVLGIGVLTKTTAVVLIPVALYGLFAKKDRRPDLKSVAACFGIALIIAIPWLIRNQTLYGDPLAIKAFQDASVGNLAAAEAMERAGGAGRYWLSYILPVAMQGFWGVFGYFDVFLPNGVYMMLNLVAVALFGGFIYSYFGADESRKRTNTLLLIMLLMVGAAFVSYNLNYYQAQGRYLYPAIFAISGALAIGVTRLLRTEKAIKIGAGSLCFLLLAINLYLVFWELEIAFTLMQERVSLSSTP
jgi:4-amino-4-deoxy-L-arabinose transferase-like glycosyltransferase